MTTNVTLKVQVSELMDKLKEVKKLGGVAKHRHDEKSHIFIATYGVGARIYSGNYAQSVFLDCEHEADIEAKIACFEANYLEFLAILKTLNKKSFVELSLNTEKAVSTIKSELGTTELESFELDSWFKSIENAKEYKILDTFDSKIFKPMQNSSELFIDLYLGDESELYVGSRSKFSKYETPILNDLPSDAYGLKLFKNVYWDSNIIKELCRYTSFLALKDDEVWLIVGDIKIAMTKQVNGYKDINNKIEIHAEFELNAEANKELLKSIGVLGKNSEHYLVAENGELKYVEYDCYCGDYINSYEAVLAEDFKGEFKFRFFAEDKNVFCNDGKYQLKQLNGTYCLCSGDDMAMLNYDEELPIVKNTIMAEHTKKVEGVAESFAEMKKDCELYKKHARILHYMELARGLQHAKIEPIVGYHSYKESWHSKEVFMYDCAFIRIDKNEISFKADGWSIIKIINTLKRIEKLNYNEAFKLLDSFNKALENILQDTYSYTRDGYVKSALKEHFDGWRLKPLEDELARLEAQEKAERDATLNEVTYTDKLNEFVENTIQTPIVNLLKSVFKDMSDEDIVESFKGKNTSLGRIAEAYIYDGCRMQFRIGGEWHDESSVSFASFEKLKECYSKSEFAPFDIWVMYRAIKSSRNEIEMGDMKSSFRKMMDAYTAKNLLKKKRGMQTMDNGMLQVKNAVVFLHKFVEEAKAKNENAKGETKMKSVETETKMQSVNVIEASIKSECETLDLLVNKVRALKLPKGYELRIDWEKHIISKVELLVNGKMITFASKDGLNEDDKNNPILCYVDEMRKKAESAGLNIDIMEAIANYARGNVNIEKAIEYALNLTSKSERARDKGVEFIVGEFNNKKRDYIVRVSGENTATNERVEGEIYSKDGEALRVFFESLKIKELINGWFIVNENNSLVLKKISNNGVGENALNGLPISKESIAELEQLVCTWDGYNNKSDSIVSKCKALIKDVLCLNRIETNWLRHYAIFIEKNDAMYWLFSKCINADDSFCMQSRQIKVLGIALKTTYQSLLDATYNSILKALEYFYSKGMDDKDFCESEYYKTFLDILYMRETKPTKAKPVIEKADENTKIDTKVEAEAEA